MGLCVIKCEKGLFLSSGFANSGCPTCGPAIEAETEWSTIDSLLGTYSTTRFIIFESAEAAQKAMEGLRGWLSREGMEVIPIESLFKYVKD